LEGAQQVAIPRHDVRPGERLGRHAERVADRQPVQCPERARAHPPRRRRPAAGAASFMRNDGAPPATRPPRLLPGAGDIASPGSHVWLPYDPGLTRPGGGDGAAPERVACPMASARLITSTSGL